MKIFTLKSIFLGLLVVICAGWVLLAGVAQPARADLTLKFETTDQDVDQAMERLMNYLWTRQRDDGGWDDIIGSEYKKKIGGTTALATLALLEAGVKLGDPRMDRALTALMASDMDDTYCRAVRVMALSQAYRLAQRKEYESQIVRDLKWLTNGLPAAGAWHYRGPAREGDNSCSQYGLLALWESEWAGFTPERRVTPAEGATSQPATGTKTPAGVKPPTPAGKEPAPATTGAAKPAATAPEANKDKDRDVDPSKLWPIAARNLAASWPLLEKVWCERQRADNGWTYAAIAPPDVASTMTMTAAGVASLYIVLDEVYAPKLIPGKPRPKTAVFDKIDSGMAWLAKGLTPEFTKDGYLAFGIERIALASGHKYIGEHDWFRLGVQEIAQRAQDRKQLDGAYGADVQASFYLLFLARGRVPVTFNKLERPGTDWDAAPRDIANLTRYLIIQLEQRMSWQIVNVDRPVREFLDAPMLFINGLKPLELKAEVVQKMREYVLRGGMIVGEATVGSADFAESFKKLMEQAFPEGKADGAKGYAWYQMPLEHPVMEGLNNPKDQQMLGTVWAMDDGTRTIAVLMTKDQATAWQRMDVVKNPQSFTLGKNLFRYATAREPLRTRLRPVFVGRQSKGEVNKKIGVLSLNTRWLSDQYAVERLSDKLAVDGRIETSSVALTDAGEVDPKECPLIFVIGRGKFEPSEKLVSGLKSFVEKGGLVFISANMGDEAFGGSAKELAKAILPGALPSMIAEQDPIFTGLVYRERGRPIKDPGLRYSLRMANVKKIDLNGYRCGDRWGVIVSPHDVFLSMLGTPIYGCKGYTGETAQQIAANSYLYALEKAEKGVEVPKQ